MSESHQQQQVVRWFKLRYPKYEGCIIASANGAHIAGNVRQRAMKISRMKAEGMKVGASDLFIAVPKGSYSGLWLEMKDEGKNDKSLSCSQVEHINLMKQVGYAAEWAAGFDNAAKIIKGYINEN